MQFLECIDSPLMLDLQDSSCLTTLCSARNYLSKKIFRTEPFLVLGNAIMDGGRVVFVDRICHKRILVLISIFTRETDNSTNQWQSLSRSFRPSSSVS